MARIAGIDIPKNKRGVISLTYIFGIGRSRAKKILSVLILCFKIFCYLAAVGSYLTTVNCSEFKASL